MDPTQIREFVRELDEALETLRTENNPAHRMLIYYLDEARDELVNLYFEQTISTYPSETKGEPE